VLEALEVAEEGSTEDEMLEGCLDDDDDAGLDEDPRDDDLL
jgi:hypothetical protein